MGFGFVEMGDGVHIISPSFNFKINEITDDLIINNYGEIGVVVEDNFVSINKIADSLLVAAQNDKMGEKTELYNRILSKIKDIASQDSVPYQSALVKASSFSRFIFNVRNVFRDDIDNKFPKIFMKIRDNDNNRNEIVNNKFKQIEEELDVYNKDSKNYEKALENVIQFARDQHFDIYEDVLINKMNGKIHLDYNNKMHSLLGKTNFEELSIDLLDELDEVKIKEIIEFTARYVGLCDKMRIKPRDIFLSKIMKLEKECLNNWPSIIKKLSAGSGLDTYVNTIIRYLDSSIRQDEILNKTVEIPSLQNIQELKELTKKYLKFMDPKSISFDLKKNLEIEKFLELLIYLNSIFAFVYQVEDISPMQSQNETLNFIKNFKEKILDPNKLDMKIPIHTLEPVLKKIMENKLNSDYERLMIALTESFQPNELDEHLNAINSYYLKCCAEFDISPELEFLPSINKDIQLTEVFRVDKFFNDGKELNEDEVVGVLNTISSAKTYLVELEKIRLKNDLNSKPPAWELDLKEKICNIEKNCYEIAVRKFKDVQKKVEDYYKEVEDLINFRKEKQKTHPLWKTLSIVRNFNLILPLEENRKEIDEIKEECKKICTLFFKLAYEAIKNDIEEKKEVNEEFNFDNNDIQSWLSFADTIEKSGFATPEIIKMAEELKEAG